LIRIHLKKIGKEYEMAVENIIYPSFVSYNDFISNTSNQLLETFGPIDITKGKQFKVRISNRKRKKINPIIRKATIEDIDEIIFIYKDIYDNSYPYKEMEDREEVKNMLTSQDVEWLMFETVGGEVVGCFTFTFDFEDKMGYTRGFMLKKKYLGKVDTIKAFMGSFLAMCTKYEGRILRWYGESRTAHAKSQYFMRPCGFRPVGFYPNKDMFFNRIESDILIVSYDEKALHEHRSQKTPLILPEIEKQFLYSNRRYYLGDYILGNPKFKLNSEKMAKIKESVKQKVVKDKFGYSEITLNLKGSSSYLTFLYTPTVQNFEKLKYSVDNLEELFILVQEVKKLARELKVRYFEAFVSAYNIEHQKIFLDIGLIPRGYIPSWKHRNGIFEDYILFNHYEGELDKNLKLLEEGWELLKCLNY